MQPLSLSKTSQNTVGLGCSNAQLYLYTPHRPPLETYKVLDIYRPAQQAECAHIIHETGNHWRKIFSIFAKFTQALFYPDLSWQHVRDNHLLTEGSQVGLLWQNHIAKQEHLKQQKRPIHLIGGQAFAESFERTWRQPHCLEQQPKIVFTREEEGAVILTPYLDYRQFTNAMIDALLPVMQQHISRSNSAT